VREDKPVVCSVAIVSRIASRMASTCPRPRQRASTVKLDQIEDRVVHVVVVTWLRPNSDLPRW
jgi:hypothetical protein